MSAGEQARPQSAEDEALRIALEQLLSKELRRELAVTSWTREPVPVTSVFPVEVLHLALGGGETLDVFVKHLGTEQADHPDKQCRDREPRVYEELLRFDDLPVPRCYGSRWNAATGRRELFLEFVGDWCLKYQGLENWFPAARRLARLHAFFARRADELTKRDFLLRLDVDYFEQWAQRALAVVTQQAAALGAELAHVVSAYRRVADLLARQPATLVHNDLAPKNVLADRAHRPARICFIDWELAGVGCGLLDLVHLKHGLAEASDRRMCAEYCAELAGTGLLPRSPSELRRLFAACELHQTMYRLAFNRSWNVPLDRVASWVADASGLSGRV